LASSIALAGKLAQSALGQCLQAPGDAFEQGFLMFRPNLFAKKLRVFLRELGDGHPPEVIAAIRVGGESGPTRAACRGRYGCWIS
jgi:hypothetical protein